MDLLLVEDKDSFRRVLSQALAGSVWSVRAVPDPQEALRALIEQPYHVLVTDLRLPGMSGLELIRRARQVRPGVRVVLMSAFAEPKDIVEAMRLGADDFLAKPFDLGAFLALLDRLAALVGAPAPDLAEPWIDHSPAMQVLDAALGKAATTRLPVLFRGSPGSGRTRAARRLHSLRHPSSPFLSVPAASLGPGGPEPQMLRMLRGGSLYLAELDQVSLDSVEALVHAMGSEAGLGLDWMAGTAPGSQLPGPLQGRLGTLELSIPSLRERREDILALALGFLDRVARQEGRPVPWLERSAERQLLDYAWPGQVRELEAVLSRSLRSEQGHAIREIPGLGLGSQVPLSLPWPAPGALDAMLRVGMKEVEAQLLRRALEQQAGDLPRTAEALGLTARVLGQRLRDHGISLEDEGKTPSRKAP
jgi:DNA-binding NtrC family response regulator